MIITFTPSPPLLWVEFWRHTHHFILVLTYLLPLNSHILLLFPVGCEDVPGAVPRELLSVNSPLASFIILFFALFLSFYNPTFHVFSLSHIICHSFLSHINAHTYVGRLRSPENKPCSARRCNQRRIVLVSAITRTSASSLVISEVRHSNRHEKAKKSSLLAVFTVCSNLMLPKFPCSVFLLYEDCNHFGSTLTHQVWPHTNTN